MINNNAFADAAKTMQENMKKINPAAAQEAFKPVMENLKAWGDLAQKQAQAAQASMTQTMEAFKGIKEPQAAFEAMKASAESSMALAAQNLKEVTALGVAQFTSSVDAMEKASPAPQAIAGLTKGMKDAAAKMETSVESALNNGAAAIKKAGKK
ncbi:hypothetical protein [Simplicispira psychrophila]|uniref:hypothetical protein n=1 Tax=Simplicispira psychrophila TaxID=80882 RepID=UPI0004862067|nr:hypothetical protein [Simplicispira psychrophila]